MTRAWLISAIALAGCFSKPSFSGRDGGPGSDAGSDAGGDDAMFDAAIDGPPPEPLALSKVSAGGRHVCAIGNDTRLWCWGDNDHGQLGASSQVATGDPVLANTGALTLDWTDIAAGTDHTCGINNTMVYCWGRNDSLESKPSVSAGGDTTMSAVALPGTPVKVFAGNSISCAILANATAYCWGLLDLAGAAMGVTQLKAGMGGVVTTFSTIGLGDDHACAIASGINDGGRLYCWGGNAHNGLGASTADRPFATPVETQESAIGGKRYLSVDATMYTTCAVTTTNEVHCWGSSGQGHLLGGADGSLDVAIDTSGTWTDVSVSNTFACARKSNGSILCWGDDKDGATGQGDFLAHRIQPLLVSVDGNATGQTSLATGEGFACVLSPNQNAWCWGANRQGELGNREIATKDRASRVRLPPLGANDVVRQIVAGFDFTCALVGPPTGGATAYCWGKNDDEQVDGASSTIAEPVPKRALGGATFVELAAGEMHVCGRNPSGAQITCWGDNGSRQLGRIGPDGSNPIDSPGAGMPWTAVAAGSRASCAIADGSLWCWGSVPGDMTRDTPFDFGLTAAGWRWQSLSMGSGFAVGIALENGTTDPRLIGFGASCPAGSGTSGTTSIGSPAWIRKGTFTGANDEYATLVVAASQHAGNHTCIHYTTKNAASTPRVACFGDNISKQVNQSAMSCDGTAGDQVLASSWRTPVTSVQSIATANAHSCALAGNGQLYCWGANSNHELADRQVSQAGNPSQVPMVNTTTWSGVTTGNTHTCVVDDPHKAVYCWGENRHGQIGDGTMFRPRPIASGLVPP